MEKPVESIGGLIVIFFSLKWPYLAGRVITPNLRTENEAPEETGAGKRMFRPNNTSLGEMFPLQRASI
jgi:hypothetical protein